MNKLLARLLLAFALVVSCTLVRAEDLGAVRARMSQRLSEIDDLKEKGVLGENNRGYLEARGDGADNGLISAENKDRETVYAAIAEQTKTSSEQVARARARQIAQSSRPGVWVQDASGAWKRK